MKNVKFDQHIQGQINQANHEKSTSRYGIIMSYNSDDNTATVLLSSPDSDSMGDLVRKVPCPVYMGVQNVAPEPGRPCWVIFKGERESGPIITHYFNHAYEQFDNGRHNTARMSIPNFQINM